MRIVNKKWFISAVVVVLMAIVTVGCATGAPASAPGSAPALSGTIEIDGSSTVFPITEAVAEEFHKLHPQMRVNVGVSGTGGGFKRFVAGETQISDASRPIKDSEKEQAQKNSIGWVEMSVAIDGLSVMVNPQNTWVTSMTVAELKKVWEPGSTVKRWNQLIPDWPDRSVNLYGPPTGDGTFDYFTEAIVGKQGASRPDYTASEDDNVLVQGISGDPNALGYFGFAYYAENKDKLKLVAIDGGAGSVLPSPETVRNGTYKPLSRALFIYVNKAALAKPEVKEFVRFYMTAGPKLVTEVGYVPLPAQVYNENLTKIQ